MAIFTDSCVYVTIAKEQIVKVDYYFFQNYLRRGGRVNGWYSPRALHLYVVFIERQTS